MKVKVFIRNVTASVPGSFENILSRYFEDEINRWLSQVNIQLVSIQMSSTALGATSLIVMCMLFYKELSPPQLVAQQSQPVSQNNDLSQIEK